MPSKSIFKSKTFWVNILLGVAAFLGALPQGATKPMILAAAANIILRKISSEPVHIVSAPDK